MGMKNKSPLIAITALVISLQFVGMQYVNAAVTKTSLKAASPKNIKVQQQYGKVIESYQPQIKRQETRDKGQGTAKAENLFIIHIQDLHTNYEAQKNTAKVLEDLIKTYGIKLVLHEGGAGDDSLAYLREGVTQAKRLQVAEKWMKDGMMSAAEYLNLTTEYDFKIYGIEDPALYDKHMEAYLEVEKAREPAADLLKRLEAVAAPLKEKIYPRALLLLEEKRSAYEGKKIAYADYLTYLSSLLKKYKVDLSAQPEFAKFLDVALRDSKLDRALVESQRAEAIEALTKVLDKNSLNSLVSKSQDFKSGKISAYDYYRNLENLARAKGMNFEAYPAFLGYVEGVKQANEVDEPKVFAQMRAAEETLERSLLKNETQKQLYQIAKDSAIFDGLLKIKLTPDDYEYLKKNKENFKAAAWCEFLGPLAAKYKIEARVPLDASALDGNFEKFVRFYEIARERDVAFLNNSKKWMTKENQNIAVLVAGGFHTPNLLEMFKRDGISYTVIAPKVTKELNEAIYRKALKEKWTKGDWADIEK